MYDFIYNLWFIYGNGRKTAKYIQMKTKEKIPLFGCPPIPPFTKMEADCFPVSENTKNKPDLV